MASRFTIPVADVGSGVKPADGAKLFFFELDGVTPKDTFPTQALTGGTENSNPVISDSNGVFPDIWFSGSLYVVLTDKNDVQKGQWDPVNETANIASSAFPKNFATLEGGPAATSAVENENLVAGDALNTAGRTAGNGGGAMWDVVLASTVTPNTFNIVQCTGVPTLALVIRNVGIPTLRQWGMVGDGVIDDSDAFENICQNQINRAFIVEQPVAGYRITRKISFLDGNRRFIGDTSVQMWTLPVATQDTHFIIDFVGDSIQLTNTTLSTPETTSNIVWDDITFRGPSDGSRAGNLFLWDVGGSANFSRGFIFNNCSAKWFANVFAFDQSTVTAGNTTEKQVGDIQITGDCSFNFNDNVIDTGPFGDTVQINKFKMDDNDISNNTTIGRVTFISGTVVGNIMEGHEDTFELINCRNFVMQANHFEGNTGEYIIKTTGDCRNGEIGPNYYASFTSKRKVWLEGSYKVECHDEFIFNQMWDNPSPNGLKFDDTGAADLSFGIMANIVRPPLNAINGNVARQVSTNHVRQTGSLTTQTDTKLSNERVLLKQYTTAGAGSFSYTKTFAVGIGDYFVTTMLFRRDTSSALDPYIQFYIDGSSDPLKGSWEGPLNNFTKLILLEDDTDELLITMFSKSLVAATSLTINFFPYGVSPAGGLVSRYSALEIHDISNMNEIAHSLNLEVLNTGDAAPTSGNFTKGDTIENRNPSAPAADRWRCTASGSPGTFIGYGGAPTATTAALADITNAVNTTDKYTGKEVFNFNLNRPVSAVGAADSDIWVFSDGTTAHTPV